MKLFGLGIIVGLFAVFGGFSGVLGLLSLVAPERLPAPALTRLVALDEKLRFLRERPELRPAILAVGSSITWRQLAGQSFEAPTARRSSGHTLLNGATGYLQVHQTHEITRFYLSHFRSVDRVLFMTSLPDYTDCTNEPKDILDESSSAAYAFERWPALYFYITHFSPLRYLKSMMYLPRDKAPLTGDMYLDAYGSGPIELDESYERRLRYEDIKPDGACIKAAARFMNDIAERGLAMTVVMAPVHPLYLSKYPGARGSLSFIERRLSRLANQHETITFLSLYEDPNFSEKDFYDAFHLEWPAVQRLSNKISMPVLDKRTACHGVFKAAKADASPTPCD